MKIKRSQKIEKYILDRESVSLKELEKHFNISMNTVRRDINELVKDPRFKKVYGGVTVNKNKLVSFENRSISNKDSKKRISEIAAQFIKPKDLIFIDSGTTTKYILDFLNPQIECTILTNNLDVINKAEHFENIQLVVVGNIFKRSTRSFVGLNQKEAYNRYNITKAFMAATGVSLTNGLMNSDLFEYEIKKHFVDKAKSVYLLADNSKLNQSTLLTYADFNQIDTVITNQPLPSDYQQYCIDHDIDILFQK